MTSVNGMTSLLDKATLYSSFLLQKIQSSLPDSETSSPSNGSSYKKEEREEDTKKTVEGKKRKRLSDSEKKAQLSKKLKTLNMDIKSESINHSKQNQPSLVKGGDLRDYQLTGVKWLISLYENGLNGILADEMGLGKTVQTISFFAHLCENGVNGPFLIVSPVSTIANWQSHFKLWTPDISSLLYHGNKDERNELRKKYFRKNRLTIPVLITSYEIIMNDRSVLSKIPWKYIVIDEGQRIKNLNCRLIRELRSYSSANRLLLTGTPLQNNVSELWSMLNFLLPEIFSDLETFQKWFEFTESLSNSDSSKTAELLKKEEEERIVTKLHTILRPFLLRRIKTDVEQSIPPKYEKLIWVEMSDLQKEYYTSLLNNSFRELLSSSNNNEEDSVEELKKNNKLKMLDEKKETEKRIKELLSDEEDDQEEEEEEEEEEEDKDFKSSSKKEENSIEKKATRRTQPLTEGIVQKKARTMSLQNIVMQLRKCCNHPYLFQWPVDSDGNHLEPCEKLIETCGKFKVLDVLLPTLKKKGHKILLFSQMTGLLDILEDYLNLRELTYVRLDGATSQPDREEAITKFNNDPKTFCFLLSTRAGGLGINLTSADVAIFYDSDWNPQVDIQAEARCHRIGQTKRVFIYRFATVNSVEKVILERAQKKRKLETVVIGKGNFKGHHHEHFLTREDLVELFTMNQNDRNDKDQPSLLPELFSWPDDDSNKMKDYWKFSQTLSK